MYSIDPDGQLRRSNGQLITRLVLVEVVILFGALLLAVQALPSQPQALPAGSQLWFNLSTVVLVLSSLPLALAVRRAAHWRQQGLLVAATLLLGLAFVLLQAVGFVQVLQWLQQLPRTRAPGDPVPGAGLQMLYVVVALHALHLLAGLMVAWRLLQRLLRHRHDAGRYPGLRLLEPYWHLLGLVWLVLYLSLVY